ncbi:MAG TPA: carboxypeptidase-like regulatory domain-containing protein [Saprospiraceae bacterium]|nr:carboxypeptidase-like regulatory domain-containing protein [Saprospiraceae bacterium]HMQ82487.1 carboxypeptidase-like regulatory domain-containing protein [Saprospiraceae bacterium]
MRKFYWLHFFLMLSSALSAQSILEQKVSIRLENSSLESAFYQLSDAQGISFSFNNQLLTDKKIDLQAEDQTLKNVLSLLLNGTGLGYKVIDNQVVIQKIATPVYTISGYVRNEFSQEALIYATVIDLHSGKGTETNAYGYFNLKLKEGPVALQVSYLGYSVYKTELTLDENQRLTILLQPLQTPLDVVEVVDTLSEADSGKTNWTRHASLPVVDIERLPTFGGESDLLRLTHLMPGVQTGTDGVGGLHVRGGDNGQNLILIDGAPLYNSSHGAGLFSIFNSHAIRSAQLIKGSFPARYGGRVSSILDVRTKEGNLSHFSTKGDVGLLSGRLSIEGPIIPNKSSFFVSGRTSFIDWYLRPLTVKLKEKQGETGYIDYRFHDLNIKANYSLGDKDKLYLSYYSGSDHYTNTGESVDSLHRISSAGERLDYLAYYPYTEKTEWANQAVSLRWHRLINDQLSAEFLAFYSSFNVQIDYSTADSLVDVSYQRLAKRSFEQTLYHSQISDAGIKADFDWSPLPNHYIRFGALASHHTYLPGALEYVEELEKKDDDEPPLLQSSEVRSQEYGLYLEDDLQVNKWRFNIGFRAAGFLVQQKHYFSFEPRLSAQRQLNKHLQLTAYWGKMTQFLHLLSNASLGLPTELWVPATQNVPPQRAWQSGLALDYTLSNQWGIGIETYYKQMNNLLSYSEGIDLLANWETSVTMGKGDAYGVELLLRKRKGALQGWLAYGLARADRRFEFLNNGSAFPYKYDRRHDLKLVAIYKASEWLDLSANWILSSGFAVSLPQSQYELVLPDGASIDVLDYGERNAFRMPIYHRLDVGAVFHFDTDEVMHQLHFGVFNLYNRQNPLYYNLKTTYEQEGSQLKPQLAFVPVPLIPLLPSVRYSIKF